MTRYDWPRSPHSQDDPAARAGHVQQFRPKMDPESIAAALPTARSSRRRRRGTPKNAPVGNQNLWFPIGPSVMTNGQATGTPNVAGRIRDIAIEPTDGLRVYAASATGGVWFSGDRGASWRPLDDWQETPDRTDIGVFATALACGAVHVIWGLAANGSQDEVWVGTGEMNAGGTRELPGGPAAGIGFLTATGPANAGAWTVVLGEHTSVNVESLRRRSVFRIVGDPGNRDQLFAATSNGFYFRPPGGTWARFAPWPVATVPIDVVLTRPAANTVRIWVVEASALWMTEFTGPAATPINPAGLVFTSVPLPDVHLDPAAVWPVTTNTRLTLAASADGTKVYVLGRRLKGTDVRAHPPAQLWSVDATAAIAALPTAATKLAGTPLDLFGTGHDQSGYDMCVTTHPTVAGRVYIGGSYVSTAGGYNAAIYRCETTATDVNPTLIGDGVHADVHVLRLGPPGPVSLTKRTMWVGCDGGLFRSDDDGDSGTFSQQNEGLAVLEPGYVASHPTNAGIVAAGFQDNGTAVRTGDTVWRQSFAGDGGGTVYDPNHANRYFRQYIQATWYTSDGGGVNPVKRRNARVAQGSTLRTSETIENDAALFYSGADAVLHGGYSHLAFGSNRVWYSRDWGRSWVTLPTGTDPRGADTPDLAQDLINPIAGTGGFSDTVGSTDSCSSTYAGTGASGSGILAVKFAVPADAGGNSRLRLLVLHALGIAWLTGTRPVAGTGAYTWTKESAQLFRAPLAGAETTAFTNGDPVKFLHAAGDVSDVAVHDPDRGPLGSCYVSTVGVPGFGVGLGARQDTLWFFDGTDTWVPTGLRTANPRGIWPNIPGTAPPRTSRITAPALGVVVDPADRNRVYVATSVGVVRGTLAIGVDGAGLPTYSWGWEQFMNGLPEAAVQDLSIHRSGNVRLLRAALQSRGVWETDLANVVTAPLTYLRLYYSDTRRRLPTPLTGAPVDGEPQPPRWDASPDIVIDTTPTAGPHPTTEAGLAALPSAGNPGTVASTAFSQRTVKVHVLVHQRWSAPEPAADVRVVLMRKAMPANGLVPLGTVWPALVTAAGAAAPPGVLPDNWTQASDSLWKNPAAPVDSRLPRVVTFDLDLSTEAQGSTFVLLAVVMSASNQITAADLLLSPGTNATTADQLVTASPHVAARSVQIV